MMGVDDPATGQQQGVPTCPMGRLRVGRFTAASAAVARNDQRPAGQPPARGGAGGGRGSRPATGFPTRHGARCPHWRPRGRHAGRPGSRAHLPGGVLQNVSAVKGEDAGSRLQLGLGTGEQGPPAGKQLLVLQGGAPCSISGHLRQSPGCQAPLTTRLPGVVTPGHAPGPGPGSGRLWWSRNACAGPVGRGASQPVAGWGMLRAS